MIVMIIIAHRWPPWPFRIYSRNVLAAKEAVLREDLQVMRTRIGSYTVDKEKAPQSLDDLVTAGYLQGHPQRPNHGAHRHLDHRPVGHALDH